MGDCNNCRFGSRPYSPFDGLKTCSRYTHVIANKCRNNGFDKWKPITSPKPWYEEENKHG